MGAEVVPAAPTALPNALAVALGYVNWNENPAAFANASTATSQTIYATSIYLPLGKVCTGVVLDVTTAAAGTKPTSFAIGLCTATKMVAQTAADISGASGVPFAATGETQIAFASTYTTLAADSAAGLYYVVMTQNGAYTTPVQFARGISVAGSGAALSGQSPAHGTLGTSQTALAANGAAVTVTAGSTGWFVGVY